MTTESATARMVRQILETVEKAFDEAGLPLSLEQREFLRDGVAAVNPRAEAFS